VRQTIAVYAITNTRTGRRYIGATRDLHTRMLAHKAALRGGRSATAGLQADWNTYGAEAFAFDTLEILPSIKGVREREDYWLGRATKEGGVYNRCPWSGFSESGYDPGAVRPSAATIQEFLASLQSAAAMTAGKTEAA
jgi:group I intron endonuclease